MHPRIRSVLVVAVVVVVAAAPAAGIAPSAAAGGSAAAVDAVDRPTLDDRSGVGDDGASDWKHFEFDDEDEADDESDDDEEAEDDDREDRDERDDDEKPGKSDDHRQDDDEKPGKSDDRRHDGHREDDESEGDDDDWSWGWDDGEERDEDGDEDGWGWLNDGDGDDRGERDRENGNENADRGNDDPSDDGDSTEGGDDGDSTERTGGGEESTSDDGDSDAPSSGDRESDGQQSDDDRTANGPGEADDSTEDRAVRVAAQEDDEGQEGDDGEGNATRNGSAEPGPDVGSANVSVLRTPAVVGQPLVVEATTTNTGTEAGRKVVQFEVEHEIVDNRSFVLQPNETKTVTFRHVFETSGNKTFEVDSGRNRFVDVAERRPNLSVSTVDVAPELVEAGEGVTITAAVSNVGHANGSLPVALELFGEVVAVQNVTLAAGESADVTFTRTVYAPGTYEAAVENETAEFEVTGDAADNSAATNDSVLESAAETPGFGSGAALVGVLVGVLVAVALALGRRD